MFIAAMILGGALTLVALLLTLAWVLYAIYYPETFTKEVLHAHPFYSQW